MLKDTYFCDSEGCTNTCKAMKHSNGDRFYEDENWIEVRFGADGMTFLDFCSWECLSIVIDKKIEEKRGGNKT